MSETIFNWLNTQCNFSPNISNIENEFANGYNFGKLLHDNNLFDNMDKLKNTQKKEDSLNNYYLIRKALDKIDVHLTDSDINELINKKRYKAELYLFKIKQKFSLKNCQFNEIMEKMNKESATNKKINFELILKNKKRNQSAKPNLVSKKNVNINTNINMNNYYNKTNGNLTTTNRNFSAVKNKNKINFINYTERLKSAKLPNLSKIQSDRKQIFNNDAKENEQEIQEEKQIQSVLNDIKIFENIHMKKNIKKIGMNIKNPWDRTNYIYNTDLLFNKNKNEEKKKATILDLIDFENKKDNNNVNNIDNKILKMKSTLHNHNQFNVDNKKTLISKKNFEKGLFKMGLNANTILPSIAKIKDKNIPSEIVMKSINDTIKENNIQKQKQNLLNNENNSPKNKKIYIPSTSPENKKPSPKKYLNSNRFNKTKANKKRPLSSAVTYNNKIKENNKDKDIKNNKNKITEDSKEISPNKKRPLTAKENKVQYKAKEVNIKKKNSGSPNRKKNHKRNNKKFLTKIEEDNLKGEEDSSFMSPSNSITENRPNDIEDVFFKNLNTEENDDKNRMKKFQMKKTENLLNKKFMKEMVSSIIDMTEVYYDYQQNNEKELIDIKKWNEVIDKFIHNKPVVKRKKKKKVLTEEEIGNLNFDLNSPMDEEYSINYATYEISEMKNYA